MLSQSQSYLNSSLSIPLLCSCTDCNNGHMSLNVRSSMTFNISTAKQFVTYELAFISGFHLFWICRFPSWHWHAASIYGLDNIWNVNKWYLQTPLHLRQNCSYIALYTNITIMTHDNVVQQAGVQDSHDFNHVSISQWARSSFGSLNAGCPSPEQPESSWAESWTPNFAQILSFPCRTQYANDEWVHTICHPTYHEPL